MPSSSKRTRKHPPASRSEIVAAILRDEILRGQYRPGERLPSERELSARFGASRGAVREALQRVEQLGIASIQPGGVRAVAVDECTLDVLGPLLDLHPIPDAKLVDEVLHIFGVLLQVAAREAIAKATPEELAAAQGIVDELAVSGPGDAGPHAPLRRLAELFIDVADHLVLRLIANGLRITFFGRLAGSGIRPSLDADGYAELAADLRAALAARDTERVEAAMRRVNLRIRADAKAALEARKESTERQSA